MKKFCALFVLLAITTFAQSKFSVGTSVHSVFSYHASSRVGYGVSLDFGYFISPKLELTFSTGYFTWGNTAQNNYAIRIMPDLLGLKYYFYNPSESVKFYAQGQLQKLSGNHYLDHYYRNEETRELVYSYTETNKLSEFGTQIGLGTVIKLNDKFDLDINGQMRLSYSTSYFETTSFATGIKYHF